MFCQFIKQYDKNINNSMKIINKIQEWINDKDSHALDNFKDLLDFILTKLHEELNNKKRSDINNESLIQDDYDEELCYKKFKENFLSKNDSQIQNLFLSYNNLILPYFVYSQLLPH